MSFKDWVVQSRERVGANGWRGVQDSAYRLYVSLLSKLDPLFPDGKCVLEDDWDLLIVLDACRVDALEEVSEEYEFLDNPGSIRSVGSSSTMWFTNTFLPKYDDIISGTIYVSANPHLEAVEDRPFLDQIRVYDWGWSKEVATTPSEVVTEAAIAASREHREEYDRMVVHYMQPHDPSVPDPLSEYDENMDKKISAWHRVRHGELSKERAWESYLENLRYVLDSVEVLLNNVNASKVVITADHAEAIGEWGVYNHPIGVPLKSVRTVPWYQTTATDNGSVNPDVENLKTKQKSDDQTVEEKLRALGYRTD